MKRSLIGLIVLGLIVLWGSAVTTSQAASLLQATPTNQVGWQAGTLVRVKPTVPFSWLRRTPSSAAAVLDTAPSGDYLVIYASTPIWDGVQWWWTVRRGNLIGYVEQDSLEVVMMAPTATGTAVPPTSTAPTIEAPTAMPGATTTPATWVPKMLLRVKPAKPFSWLRGTPSSGALPVDYAPSLDFLSVVSATPQWDGVQWWWQVRRVSGSITGYVEQDSLEPVTAPAPTASPTPVSATPSGSLQPPAPAAWSVGSLHSVKLTVRFAWVRLAASSNAGVQATIYPGWLVVVRDATPYWDGAQWWWYVSVPAFNAPGWIEQNSLA
jgi:hypothetical protein